MAVTEKQKLYYQKWRRENYERCLELNRISNKKRYHESADIRFRKKMTYHKRRFQKQLLATVSRAV